jgi:hypothetical protein
MSLNTKALWVLREAEVAPRVDGLLVKINQAQELCQRYPVSSFSRS